MREMISNTSCLIALSNIEMLDVLRQVYGNIIITSEVAAEFGEPLPGWLQVVSVQDAKALRILQSSVDLGEASTIALAMERGGDVTMILDDLKARKLAQSLDLKFTGTIGVLIKAKQQGCNISLEECIERFHACGFRLSAAVEAVLRRADE